MQCTKKQTSSHIITFDINLCLKLSSQCHLVESDSCATVNRSVHTSPHQVHGNTQICYIKLHKLRVFCNASSATRSPALHNGDRCRTAPEQPPHRNPEEGSASEPAEHDLGAAVPNSGTLREPPRLYCSIPAPLAAPPPSPDLTAARRRRGNPRSGLASAMALGGSTSRGCGAEVCSGKVSVSVSVSEPSSRRGGTVTLHCGVRTGTAECAHQQMRPSFGGRRMEMAETDPT